MAGKTLIEWTDRTWNPTRGCSMAKGSEAGGCLNCYAARMASRGLPGLTSPTTGRPFARILDSGPRWTGEVELIESALILPLKWRKPQRVFVNSMSDLFHENLQFEQIKQVWRVMKDADWHTFQILTKRAGRMAELVPYLVDMFGLLPHVHLGVSVEDKPTADERISLLLRTPAAKRFVSYEPALGPVDWSPLAYAPKIDTADNSVTGWGWLDWIIVGGESGPGARSFNVQWARNTIRQCREAGVACFVKQLGAYPVIPGHRQAHYDWGPGIGLTESSSRFTAVEPHRESSGLWRIHLNDRKGGDMSEWPEDLRVRELIK